MWLQYGHEIDSTTFWCSLCEFTRRSLSLFTNKLENKKIGIFNKRREWYVLKQAGVMHSYINHSISSYYYDMVYRHSRNRTISIVLAMYTVVYMIVHYSSLFQYFYWLTIVPTLVENLYTSSSKCWRNWAQKYICSDIFIRAKKVDQNPNNLHMN